MAQRAPQPLALRPCQVRRTSPRPRAEHEYKGGFGSAHASGRVRDRPAARPQGMNCVKSSCIEWARIFGSASRRTSKDRPSARCAAVGGRGEASTPRQVQLGFSASRVRLELLASSYLASKNKGKPTAQSMVRRFIVGCAPGVSTGTSRPNPSLNRRSNGRPPSPVWRYALNFRLSGLGVLPLPPG